MPRHSSYRTSHGMDAMSSDWSTGQLVIGIAVALVFGITCFATGYVIARTDPPIGGRIDPPAVDQEAIASTVPAPGANDEAPINIPVEEPESSRAPATPPAAAPSSTTTPTETVISSAQEPGRAGEAIQRPGFRPTAIEPLPDPGRAPMVRTPVDLGNAPAAEVQPAAPGAATTTTPESTPPNVVLEPMEVAINTQPETPPAGTAVTQPVRPSAAPATDAATPPTVTPPITPPVQRAPAATPPAVIPPKPQPPTKPSTAPTVTKGTFGIQVAAFEGPRRSEQAKEFQRNLKETARQDAEIIVTPDGSYHKVIVTGFATRDAAKAACEKLKSKPGLSGAWVVRL